jgi:hypothetical protein
LNGFGIVILDKINDKKINKQNVKKEQNPEEDFKFSDVFRFKLPFWLLTISCVVTYMSIFVYIHVVSDMVQKRNKIDSLTGGKMFGIPYLISAIVSPIMGKVIDKLGRRALLVTFSSIVLIIII